MQSHNKGTHFRWICKKTAAPFRDGRQQTELGATWALNYSPKCYSFLFKYRISFPFLRAYSISLRVLSPMYPSGLMT